MTRPAPLSLTPTSIPFDQQVDGTILHVDLVGFGRLARDLDARGAIGAEDLAQVLDQYFGTTIGAVLNYSGLVAAFAGDALTAVWPDTLSPEKPTSILAIAAGLRIISQLPADLSCRISITHGPFTLARITPDENTQICAVLGPALEEVMVLNELAASNSIIVTRDFARMHSGHYRVKPLNDPNYAMIASAQPIPAPDTTDAPALTIPHDATPLANIWTTLEGAKRGGTFREMTILSLDLSAQQTPTEITVDTFKSRLETVCAELVVWGGTPINIVVEAKGIVLHVAFGLPPMGPSERDARALRAARAIAGQLGTDTSYSIGLARGRMFFSRHGSAQVQTVSAFGWPSALATRLMQHANGEIYATFDVITRAGAQFSQSSVEHINVKSSPAGVPVVRIHDELSIPTHTQKWSRPQSSVMVQLEALLEPDGPSILTLAGARGIGKSYTCRALARAAMAARWQVVVPDLQPSGANIPHDGIIRLIEKLSALIISSEHPSLDQRLNDNPSWAARRYLLPNLANSAHVQQWPQPTTLPQGEARLRAIGQFAIEIITHVAMDQSVLVIFDDAHALDATSYRILQQLVQQGHLRALLARQSDADIDADITLPPLPLEHSTDLICGYCQVERVEYETAVELHRITNGNPQFLEELIRALRTSRILEDSGGTLRLSTTSEFGRNPTAHVPESLRDLVVARLDNLQSEDRWVLSVASIIGTHFNSIDLSTLIHQRPDHVVEVLEQLVKSGELSRQAPGDYSFQSDLTCELAYQSLPFAVRREFHTTFARDMPSQLNVISDLQLASLARHHAGAENISAAVRCHSEMARRASTLNAHRDTMAHTAAARALINRNKLALGPGQKADLLMLEGSAALEMVELRHAESTLNEVLVTLEMGGNATKLQTITGIVPALLRQTRNRMLRPPRPRADAAKAMASRAHKNLAEIAYFDGKLPQVLHHTLTSLNLAEATGQSSEIVAGFAALAVGSETFNARKIADYYLQRSLNVADIAGSTNDIAFANLVGLVIYSGRADWENAQRNGLRAEQLYDKIGAYGRWLQTSATLLHGDVARGVNATTHARHNAVDRELDTSSSAQMRVWSLTAHFAFALQSCTHPTAAHHDALVSLMDHPQLNVAERLLGQAMLAQALVLNGKAAQAQTRVRDALRLIEVQPPAAWHLSEAMGALAMSSYLSAQLNIPGAKQDFKQAESALSKFAKTVPIARAKAQFYRGLHHHNRGSKSSARQHFAQAATTSHNNALRPDQLNFEFALDKLGFDPADHFSVRFSSNSK